MPTPAPARAPTAPTRAASRRWPTSICDGAPEIVTGKRAYEADGTPVWTASTPDGYPAIAQFDDDAQPEVVLVASGQLYLLDGMTGEVQWGPVAQPGGGIGGPPTVADFDGDGMPEIGVAGAHSYSVYDPTGTADVVWSMTTQDVSSNATGSSVFDFEGDGVAEVVYGDECYMRAYRGSDGSGAPARSPRRARPSTSTRSSPTWTRTGTRRSSSSPTTATPRCAPNATTRTRSWDGARRGLFVYGDTRDQWVRTRRIWNQHAYHVTNVDASGIIPAVEVNNWSTPRSQRLPPEHPGRGRVQRARSGGAGAGSRPRSLPGQRHPARAHRQRGNLGVAAGVNVSFYPAPPTCPARSSARWPPPSRSCQAPAPVVELADVPLSGDPPYSFFAVADDDGTSTGAVAECHEDNNTGTIADLDCQILD